MNSFIYNKVKKLTFPLHNIKNVDPLNTSRETAIYRCLKSRWERVNTISIKMQLIITDGPIDLCHFLIVLDHQRISYYQQSLKYQIKMQTFAYWHAYFDSIFLKSHPRLSSSFIKDMQLERAIQTSWNKCKFLPQLTNLLQFLQNFIINADWKQSNCSESQSKKIQSHLNNLLCLIQAQKVYGRQYWSQNQRRVQASVVHHYFYLKMLIHALIPQHCRTITEALLSKKLCIQITKIEDLINHYLQNLRQVYIFLYRDRFSQERSLTKQLFQSINKFWQKLPQLSRSELLEIPKIMRYICLNNPLDPTFDKDQSSNMLQLRKKSQTIENNGRIKACNKSQKFINRKSDILIGRQSLQNKLRYDSAGKTESKQTSSDNKEKKHLFFKFKRQFLDMNPNRSQKLEQSNTSISRQTINKKQQPKQDRFRATTFVQSPILRTNTSITKDSRLTVQKQRFIGQVRDRMITRSAHSELSLDRNKIMHEQQEQQQLQRRARKKVTKNIKQKTKFNTISNFMHLQTGKVKGWAVVRQNINQKIVKNKLRKLMLT